jgi:hypothetical protein
VLPRGGGLSHGPPAEPGLAPGGSLSRLSPPSRWESVCVGTHFARRPPGSQFLHINPSQSMSWISLAPPLSMMFCSFPHAIKILPIAAIPPNSPRSDTFLTPDLLCLDVVLSFARHSCVTEMPSSPAPPPVPSIFTCASPLRKHTDTRAGLSTPRHWSFVPRIVSSDPELRQSDIGVSSEPEFRRAQGFGGPTLGFRPNQGFVRLRVSSDPESRQSDTGVSSDAGFRDSGIGFRPTRSFDIPYLG